MYLIKPVVIAEVEPANKAAGNWGGFTCLTFATWPQQQDSHHYTTDSLQYLLSSRVFDKFYTLQNVSNLLLTFCSQQKPSIKLTASCCVCVFLSVSLSACVGVFVSVHVFGGFCVAHSCLSPFGVLVHFCVSVLLCFSNASNFEVLLQKSNTSNSAKRAHPKHCHPRGNLKSASDHAMLCILSEPWANTEKKDYAQDCLSP